MAASCVIAIAGENGINEKKKHQAKALAAWLSSASK